MSHLQTLNRTDFWDSPRGRVNLPFGHAARSTILQVLWSKPAWCSIHAALGNFVRLTFALVFRFAMTIQGLHDETRAAEQ